MTITPPPHKGGEPAPARRPPRSELQPWTYTDLPKALGFQATPPWWPLPLLAVAGLLVGLATDPSHTTWHLPLTAAQNEPAVGEGGGPLPTFFGGPAPRRTGRTEVRRPRVRR
ncbi:hypothetical protein GCM10010230_10840 [Streptomyces narbonensis]|nr:hypothetical protein GCM10010230_10840 [Streptomyces narbonensis]